MIDAECSGHLESRFAVKIIMMVLADYAAVESNTGKLNVIGVFNRILAEKFPHSHYRMYLAVKFEGAMIGNAQPHDLSVTLTTKMAAKC